MPASINLPGIPAGAVTGQLWIPIAGFGASDCRAHCASHRKYLGQATLAP